MNTANWSTRLGGARDGAPMQRSLRIRGVPTRLVAAVLLLGGLASPTLTHHAAAAGSGASRPANAPSSQAAPNAGQVLADLRARTSVAGAHLAQTTPLTTTVGSTVPANGDVNPYGVAVVPRSAGKLVQGDVLVSNFNNKANLQGTGTTIVEISPSGTLEPFASITAGIVTLTPVSTYVREGFPI